MKKTIIISGIAFSAIIATQSVYAVAGNADDRATMRADKRAEIVDKKADKQAEKICNRITTRTENMREKTANREQLGLEKITEKLAQVKERRTIRHEELVQRRAMRDAQRQKFYDALIAQATTAEQKEAVKHFETTIENAVTVRRTAIDLATKNMQDAVDALVVEKQNTIEKLFADYKVSEEAAFAKAESACSDTSTETDLKSIAKTLNAELKTAREKFRTGVRETRTMGTEIQKLAETKRIAVQTATNTFKEVVQQARIELQKAFGGTIDVDTDTTNIDGEVSE
jgi:hypothetical protein